MVQTAYCLACNTLGLEFGSTVRLSKRPGSVWNCLWGHALKRSLGIYRKRRVLYPGPGFLSSATWPLMPKKHFNGLINQSIISYVPTGKPFCARSSAVSKNVSCSSQCLSHAAHKKFESKCPHEQPDKITIRSFSYIRYICMTISIKDEFIRSTWNHITNCIWYFRMENKKQKTDTLAPIII